MAARRARPVVVCAASAATATRGTTMAKAAPAPIKTLPVSSNGSPVADPATSAPRLKVSRPPPSARRRPARSVTSPATNMPTPKAMMNTGTLSCARKTGSPSAEAMSVSPGT
jgi:hypothetical protein